MNRLTQVSLAIGVMFITFFLLLSGCATKRYPFPNDKLTQESWMNSINTNPIPWARDADRWFKNGEPNATEIENRHAPVSAAVSTMQVRAKEFHSIRVDGDFQVQIFGTTEANSVFVYGPNAGVRSLGVQVKNKTLCITQDHGSSRNLMHKVIVRIGINYLKSITQVGCGTIEGVGLHSNSLVVNSCGSGAMYLAGNMRVRHVDNTGPGNITMYGVNTPAMTIYSAGSGTINLSGNVGVRSIKHCGTGDINIIGVTSQNAMTINTEGSGKIGISGPANIAKIVAKGHTCVFACPVASSSINVCEYDNASVGLTGSSQSLVVEANNSSRFFGRYLCVSSAFVRARDNSHVNVSAGDKIFAAATQGGSVYFYGEPKIMSQFVSGNGSIVPLWSPMYRSCGAPRVVRANSYKGEG